MRICIVEDEKSHAENLAKMIQSVDLLHEIKIYNSAEAFLFDYESKILFDVLFLDIQLKEMNGMDLAKKIREKDLEVQIVFLTGIIDYALEGYEVNAVRYLLKPIQHNKCKEILSQIEENMKRISPTILIGNTKVKIDDIYCIKSEGHYSVVYADNEYMIKKQFGKWKKELPTEFVLCHRSYIVNMKHVKSVFKEYLIVRGKSIPISRSMSKIVHDAFLIQMKDGMII